MMQAGAAIMGVGTDVVAISRVAELWANQGAQFLQRVLTPAEQAARDWNPATDAPRLARRWALKEAAAKALGTGIGGQVGFRQLEVSHTPAGAPQLVCTAPAFADVTWHVSVSDDTTANVATAFVVACRGGGA